MVEWSPQTIYTSFHDDITKHNIQIVSPSTLAVLWPHRLISWWSSATYKWSNACKSYVDDLFSSYMRSSYIGFPSNFALSYILKAFWISPTTRFATSGLNILGKFAARSISMVLFLIKPSLLSKSALSVSPSCLLLLAHVSNQIRTISLQMASSRPRIMSSIMLCPSSPQLMQTAIAVGDRTLRM